MTLADLQTEKQFQAAVRQYAAALGWHVYCVWNSRHSPKGWPDLTLIRPPRLVFAELKSARGKPTPEQSFTLDLLQAAGAEAYLWRPADWPEIEAVLR